MSYYFLGMVVGFFFGSIMMLENHKALAKRGGKVDYDGVLYKVTKVM